MGYQDILERLSKATGPDRELDLAIYYDVLGMCRHANKERSGAQSDTGFDCADCGADSWGNKGKFGQELHDTAPFYTASLDSTIALIERVLPGWGYTFHKDDENTATSLWTPEGKATEHHYQVQGNTLSLSALTALFHALEAKEKQA